MKLKWQLTKAFFLSLILLAGFGLTALLVSEHKINQFDDRINNFIRGFETPFMTQTMKLFTFIGSVWAVTGLVILITIILLKVSKNQSEIILFLFAIIGSAFLNVALKHIFHRTRPILHRIINATGFSFPSGHSMSAFALYGIMAFLLWQYVSPSIGRFIIIIVSITMITMIGVSRIYLGVHYPSDVLGGYLISGSWIAVSIWFYQRYKENRHRNSN